MEIGICLGFVIWFLEFNKVTFDLLIKNGMIVDGSGKKPAFKADIGISGDKIFDIGNLSKAKAKTEIDASGKIVAPGFIDIQNHSDNYGSIFADNHFESIVRQGITTILMGQCGSSLAPLVKGSLSSIQKWTAVEGINVNWQSQAEFFKSLSSRGSMVNLSTLVGHATLRRDFVGDAMRPLSSEEEDQICSLLKESMREGAFGLSIGLAYSHERLAAEEELHKLLKIVLAESGVVSFHLRNEGREAVSSMNEIFTFLRHNRVRSKISHLKALGENSVATAEKLLKMLDVAYRDGLPISFDVYPYMASAVVLYLLLPEWAVLGGKAELEKRIRSKEVRKDIIKDMDESAYPYEKIFIATGSLGQGFIGKSLAQIAKDQGVSGPEAVLNMLIASRDQIIVFWHDLDESVVETFIKHPLSMVATDGSGYSAEKKFGNQIPHPRSFGTTARLLGHYVREKKILTLEEAVYKISGKPALWLGLKDRGIIEKNNFADLVVFDAQTIKDLADYKNPFRYPEGIDNVIVNGKIALEKGECKLPLAGRVIRKTK